MVKGVDIMKPTSMMEEIIKNKMEKDGTILCYGETLLDDCNNNVCHSSIALRELMIYGNINAYDKANIQSLLNRYGNMIDGDYNKDIIDDIDFLLGKNCADLLKKIWESEIFTPILNVIENMIDLLLLKYYEDYEIPTENYDEIVYSHNVNNSYDEFNYHLECLKNPSLDWNGEYKEDFVVTYKDIKKIIFQARDSGGNLDCFGYAVDTTTMNCVVSFMCEKIEDCEHDGNYFQIKHKDKNREKELKNIAEELYYEVIGYMSEFYVELC